MVNNRTDKQKTDVNLLNRTLLSVVQFSAGKPLGPLGSTGCDVVSVTVVRLSKRGSDMRVIITSRKNETEKIRQQTPMTPTEN